MNKLVKIRNIIKNKLIMSQIKCVKSLSLLPIQSWFSTIKPLNSQITKKGIGPNIQIFMTMVCYFPNIFFLNHIRAKILKQCFLTYNTVIRPTRFCDFSDVTMHKAQMREVYKYLHTGFDKYPCVCATKTAGSLKLDAENRNMLFHIEWYRTAVVNTRQLRKTIYCIAN